MSREVPAAPQPLAGIRVVDFSTGPLGGHATTVLADFGAEVVSVEPPGGDRFRSLASAPFWTRTRTVRELDLASASAQGHVADLLTGADVCVVSGPPKRIHAHGLDSESLRSAHPRLVHCSLTGFGMFGPLADLAGYEGVVAAKAGRMSAFDVQLQQDRPVYAAVQVATHLASQGAVHGILAALLARESTGQGAAVEASLLQGLMPFDLVDMLATQIAERDATSFTPLRQLTSMPTLNYHPLRTSDGRWIQCGNLLEHLFMSFLDATDLLGELMIDERFQSSPATWSPEAIEEARDRMLVRMQERTADEWMAAFDANGNVAAEPILTTAEALSHRDIACSLITVDDPTHGPTTQIGPIADVIPVGSPAPIRLGSPTSGRPLSGVTILDLSTIIAAPLGMSMLADLGARVIKVEPLGGDPFRHLLTEGRMAVKTNAGKESICINLKLPEGQQLLHKLAADADVLMHNFRGNVPAKLGIDHATLAAINPSIIWAVVNGYHADSPSATRPATHPVMGASTGGVAWQAGDALTRDCPTLADVREAARQIAAANEANPDPNTSVVAASAVLLALMGCARTGDGQIVRINMQTANAWANGDDFLSYAAKPDREAVDAGHHGLAAGYRLYQTAKGWVFLAAVTDAEFASFCTTAGCPELAANDLFTTAAARRIHDAALSDAIAGVFLGDTADAWEARLTAASVGCVRADGIDVGNFWASDAHVVSNGWAPEVDHARFGRLRRWGPLSTVDGPRDDYDCAPLAGEHTDALLREIGCSDAEIARLRADKIVSSEPVEVAAL